MRGTFSRAICPFAYCLVVVVIVVVVGGRGSNIDGELLLSGTY